MSSPLRLVAGREISERLHGRLIYFLTALSCVVVVAALVIPALVKRPPKPSTIGLVGAPAQSLRPAITAAARAARQPVRLEDFPEAATARARVAAGTLDAEVIADRRLEVTVDKSLDDTIIGILRTAAGGQKALSTLGSAGVSTSTVEEALAPVPVAATILHPPPPDQGARAGAAIGAAVFLYVSILTYGGGVAGGVAQEKTSRTSEVLLSSISSRELLTGKVAGIGAVGLGQIVVTVLAGVVANAATHHTHFTSVFWGLLPSVLVWFLLGYALYSFAFAAAGALVARPEEVQMVMAPFTLVLVGSYLLVFSMIQTPDALWVRLLSYIPPLSPTLMPARMALGHVAWWEWVLAVGLNLLTTALIVRFGARIYRRALMRGGARLSWRAALALPDPGAEPSAS